MSDTVELKNCPKCGAPIPPGAPQGLCPKCVLMGAASTTETGLPPTATSEIPSIKRVAAAFPQLEILELIGRGGMGFVFKARQPHLDRFVALKLLPDKLAQDPRFAERFNREGRMLARLNHPNIVTVYDFGQTEQFYFLLMEFVDGVNLRQAMQAGRFSPGEALAIVPKICEALQYAHGQGILHRDIKPENILLDSQGHVKIADFGIAKLVGEEKSDVSLTQTGAALGTPHYMAPEQLEKPADVDHRADIYSLGVVFYEMLTGELPIGRFAAPSSKTPVSANVDDVVFRTLEKDREKRYQSAGEVKSQVEHLTTADATAGPTRAASVDNSDVARPAKALIAAGVFNWVASVAVVCVLAFGVLSRQGAPSVVGMTVVCVAIFGLSSLIIAGGLKMLRLESYALAVAGSLAALITSPGSIVGFPIGIWALLTLRQPKVRAAFERNRPQPLPPKLPEANAVVPKWSQKAVWGAALTGLSLPVPILLMFLLYFVSGGFMRFELTITAAIICLPALAGILLGWMALSDIRAHQGALRGLPLAVFAALAWPLFLLVGVMVLAPWLISYSPSPGSRMPFGALLILMVPVGTITFAIWAVYAAARWGANRPASERRGVLKWVFTGLLLACIGFVLLRISGSRAARVNDNRPAPMFGMERATPETLTASPASFGPEREIILPEPDTGIACLLDFETGKLLAPPEALSDRLRVGMAEIEEADVTWLRNSGADAVVNMPNTGSLRLFEGVAMSMAHKPNPPLRWEQFTPADVASALGQVPFERNQRFRNSERTFYGTPALSPDALAFITREGSTGVMEIIRLNTNPRGVKLRYKLVQGSGVRRVEPEAADPNNRASAELWSPKLAPGEKPDPQKILDEARQLTANHQYEEALQRHLWYHNHALEFRPSQSGVRLSFALIYWMELAREYPKAKQALIEIRDRGTAEFAGGGESLVRLVEVSSINKQLGDDDATLALFKSIHSRNPNLARKGYPLAEDWLVQRGEYALCASYIPNFHNRFESARAARERALAAAERTPEMNELMRSQADRTFIRDTRKLIELLVGVGRKAEAEQIRDEAVEIVSVPELQSAVTDAERQIARHSTEHPAHRGAKRTNAQSEPTLGPEVEVTLSDMFSGGAPLAIERKQPVSLPPEGKKWNRTTLLNWLDDEGVDLAAIHYDDDQYGWGIAIRPSTRRVALPWSGMTVPKVAEAATRADMPLEKIDGVPERMELHRLYATSLPVTFVIRTHAGREGVLQITGITNIPPAVRLRYKLLIPPAIEEP